MEGDFCCLCALGFTGIKFDSTASTTAGVSRASTAAPAATRWRVSSASAGQDSLAPSARTKSRNATRARLALPRTGQQFQMHLPTRYLNLSILVLLFINFNLICWTGWTGQRCEEDINFYELQPCLNANCINLLGDFFCACPSDTDGKRYETAPDRYIGDPCMNDGLGRDFSSGLNCPCDPDYVGVGCQHEFDVLPERHHLRRQRDRLQVRLPGRLLRPPLRAHPTSAKSRRSTRSTRPALGATSASWPRCTAPECTSPSCPASRRLPPVPRQFGHQRRPLAPHRLSLGTAPTASSL